MQLSCPFGCSHFKIRIMKRSSAAWLVTRDTVTPMRALQDACARRALQAWRETQLAAVWSDPSWEV